jgi:hypothetical protein
MRNELLDRPATTVSPDTTLPTIDFTLYRNVLGIAGELEPDPPPDVPMEPNMFYKLGSFAKKGMSFVREHKSQIAITAVAVASLGVAIISESKHSKTELPTPS